MKKSMKVATALAGAAVVVAGGSAFTNSISGMEPDTFYGYSSQTVHGVTITSQTFTPVSGDTSKVQNVIFVEQDDQADRSAGQSTPGDQTDDTFTATLSIDMAGAGEDPQLTYDCAIAWLEEGATNLGVNTYTCTTTGGEGLSFNDIDKVGFSVSENNLD